jgi:hypothetical protein
MYKVMAYKIWWADEPGKFYVGGTTAPKLSHRMTKHRSATRAGKTSLIHQTMREKGVNLFKYILLGSKMVTCVDEERQFEQEWIDRLSPTLN